MTAQKNQGIPAPGARPSGTTNGLSPFTINMTYKKKVTTKTATLDKFVTTHEQFLLLNTQVPPNINQPWGYVK